MSSESTVLYWLGHGSSMAALALLFFLTLPSFWRSCAGHLRREGETGVRPVELVGLLALTVAGFLLRTLLSEPSALLSGFNDIKNIQDAMCLAGQTKVCELTHAYPPAVASIHALTFRLAGPSLLLTYYTNAALSALTIPAIWLLGTLLGRGRRSVGWLAALALTALPVHIRFAATGSLTAGFVLFATLAFAFTLLAVRTADARAVWMAGLAAFLAALARYEGVVALLALLVGVVALESQRLRALWDVPARWHALGAAALVALAGALPIVSVLGQEGNVGGGGWLRLGTRLGLAVAAAVIYVVMGWLVARYAGRRRDAVGWVAGLLFVAVGVALLGDRWFPVDRLFAPEAWPAFSNAGLDVPSYASGGLPALNPRSFPAPSLALLLLGFVAGATPRWRRAVFGPALWWALLAVITPQKNTGELPFEGMRTAVDLAPPFSLVVALGAVALTDLLRPQVFRRTILAVAAAALIASPLLTLPMLRDSGFNNQQQLAFLARTMPQLPQDAIVIYPDGGGRQTGEPAIARLFHTREVWWVLGRVHGGGRKDRFVGTTEAVANRRRIQGLIDGGARVLFWQSLECRRTGNPEVFDRPECGALRRAFDLRPLQTEVVPNRPFEWDFYDRFLIHGGEIELGIFEVIAARR